jgi:hypothetical protein
LEVKVKRREREGRRRKEKEGRNKEARANNFQQQGIALPWK